MIRIGTKVKITELHDPSATDEAVGRRVEIGETGKVEEHDPHREPRDNNAWDCWLIRWDRGGACYMGRGEIERI